MPADFVWRTPIELFWQVRNEQTQKQIEAGAIDAGTRGSVTGGKHMDALTAAVETYERNAQAIVQQYQQLTHGLPTTERTPTYDEIKV